MTGRIEPAGIVTPDARTSGKPDPRLVEQTAETSKNASSIFVLILLAVVYCYFAIAMTNDPALLSNSANLSLPIVEQTVPILWFYYAAPILLVVLFFYFQICMQGYWRNISKLQRSPHDDRLDEYLPPSVINAIFLRPWLTLSQQAKLEPSALGSWILMGVAIGFVPLVLVFFWGRFLVRHDWPGTILHIVLIVLAGLVVIYALDVARRAVLQDSSAGATGPVDPYRLIPSMALTAAVLSASTLYISYGAINGAPSALCRLEPNQSCGPVYAGAGLMEWLNYEPIANFNGSEVSVKPSNWVTIEDPNEETLDAVSGARLARSDLRHMHGRRAFLVDAELTGADLRWADLERADLRGAHLDSANLSGANLKEAKLQRSFMTDAKLEGTNLNQALLANATIDGAKFIGAKLPDAVLSGSHGLKINFERANLQNANLEKSELRISNFNSATMRLARMADGDFSGSSFVGATLLNCGIENARLNDARFESAVVGPDVPLPQRTVLRKANMTRASVHQAKFMAADLVDSVLVGIQGERADFTWAILTRAKLGEARLNKGTFQNADLAKADLTDAFLSEADFSHAQLPSASLKSADLRKAKFAGANLEKASLAGATLRDAILAEATLSEADFAGADLTGADLSKARLDGANFLNAKGLTQAQLDQACGSNAALPIGLQVSPCQ